MPVSSTLKAMAVVVTSAALLGSCGARFLSDRKPAGTTSPAATGGGGAAPAGGVTIYSNLGEPASIKARWSEWGVKPAYIMYQDSIDPKKTNTWSAKDLTFRWLGQNVPKDFDGPLCLDWEADVLEILPRGPENNHQWRPVVDEMVKLLKYVQQERPKAKVGFYGLPSSKYWNQNQAYIDRQLALREIYEASTALFPSAYDHYGEAPERDRKAFTTVMELALQCAQGKPVYVYTWHRYHLDETNPWAFKLIPGDEYEDHLKTLLRAQWKGDRIDGLITWGAERYWYTASQQRKADGGLLYTGKNWDRVRDTFKGELSGSNFDARFEKLCEQIYSRMRRAINEASAP